MKLLNPIKNLNAKKISIKKFNPFNNSTDVPASVYIVKKLLAFFMVFAITSVVGEVIVIAGLCLAGYDPLNGVFPTGIFGTLLPFYGRILFIATMILYCRLVEKRTVSSMGIKKKGMSHFFVGAILAVVLLVAVIAVCCLTGTIKYSGFNSNVDWMYIVALFFALVIQATSEEVMCRGFLLPSLLKKTSVPVAIFVSSTAFAVPHLLTLLEAETQYIVVGIVNLYLVSVVFSLLMLCSSNIWSACGLHIVWNFILYGVFGLTLSGSQSNSDVVLKFETASYNILNGGVYGVEASVITTVVLFITVMVLIKRFNKKENTYGL